MNENIQDYISFVTGAIEKYKKSVNFIYNNEVNPHTINEALASYSEILFVLTSEYQRKKAEAYELELNFQTWWDEKFTLIRRELNNTDLPASKWVSKQEIESEVRYRNREEYKDWKAQLFGVQSKVSFYRQMLENWKRVDSILVQLSNNMRAEMKSLSTEDRANRKLNEEERAYTMAVPKTPKRRLAM